MGRRCPAPRSRGRRAGSVSRWRRCGNTADACGPSSSCECELPCLSFVSCQLSVDRSRLAPRLLGAAGVLSWSLRLAAFAAFAAELFLALLAQFFFLGIAES